VKIASRCKAAALMMAAASATLGSARKASELGWKGSYRLGIVSPELVHAASTVARDPVMSSTSWWARVDMADVGMLTAGTAIIKYVSSDRR
jgi:hypothetical protein